MKYPYVNKVLLNQENEFWMMDTLLIASYTNIVPAYMHISP